MKVVTIDYSDIPDKKGMYELLVDDSVVATGTYKEMFILFNQAPIQRRVLGQRIGYTYYLTKYEVREAFFIFHRMVSGIVFFIAFFPIFLSAHIYA